MKRCVPLLVDCLVGCASLVAPVVGQLPSSSSETQSTIVIDGADRRPQVSLNGDWHVIIDPYFSGLYDVNHQERRDGWFKDEHPLPNDNRLHEYDFEKSPTLRVPGDWNTQRADLFFYEGTVWYQRDFDYLAPSGHRTYLHVGAANYRSWFWVNGKKVCQHEGGYTTFDCDVTGALKPGSNTIVAAVNAERLHDGLPSLETDWWNYGGITRDVSLIDVPNAFIQQYDLHLDKGTRSVIEGWVQIMGAKPDMRVVVEIPEIHAITSGIVRVDGRAPISMQVHGLTLWSPESPKLYRVKLRAEKDELDEEMGFKTIETHGSEILLNGRPIFLRGVSIHAEAPFRTGRANTEKDVTTLLGWAKELGCNYVRLAHYPHDSKMTRAADRMGLLVWSEIPVYWAIDFGNPAVLAKAKFMLHEEIDRDRNRASIGFWSIGNETPNTPERLAFLTALASEVRSTDNSRLVTAAVLVRTDGNMNIIDDPLGRYLDVIGFNEYIGWYGAGTPSIADKSIWKVAEDKPLIVSEFGADAKAGLHGRSDTRWTEEYQQNVYEHQLHMLGRISQLRGMSPWVLMDFRSPSRQLPGIQDYFNRKGLISDQGEKKIVFFTLQKTYRAKSIGSATGVCIAPESCH